MKVKALSQGEEAFALHCRAEKLEPVREHRFHPERKWRFDFYFPEQRLAVEVEGVGRHQSFKGFEADCRKYAEAALLGITVMRFTTKMVTAGEAIDAVLKYLRGASVSGKWFTDKSYVKHKLLRQIARAQAHAYRYTHRGAEIVLIDTKAGDGHGVYLPQRNLCFDDDDIDDETSRPSPLMLADLYQQVGAAGLMVCEKNKGRRESLSRELSKVIPSAVVLDRDRRLLEVDLRKYDHALVISDPCGYSEKENGGGHHVEILRSITSQINADFVLTFNGGALDRLLSMKDEGKENELRRVAGVRAAKPEYLWMLDLEQWAMRLGRRCAARSRIIHQSAGYRFQLIVVANHFANCINHEWEIFRGGVNGIQRSQPNQVQDRTATGKIVAPDYCGGIQPAREKHSG